MAGGFSGIAFEAIDLSKQQDTRAIPALGKEARRNETVAAIVAGTAQHGDIRSGRPQRGCRVRDGCARRFHQSHAGSAGSRRQPVRPGHLLVCEKYDHPTVLRTH
jgi:hypothetical protein